MNKRILAAFTAIAVAASTLTILSFADSRPTKIDSVPVKSGTFEEDNNLFTGRALGVANDFHLFAFDTIDLQAHCNGNFGAPIVNAKSQASGTSSGSLGSGAGGETSKEDEPFGTYPYNFRKEVSLATDTLTLDADCKVDYLFFPENTNLYGPDELSITDSQKVEVADDGTISGEDPRLKVGASGSAHKFEAKIGYIYSDYLDFKGKYLDFYKTMSYNLSEITEENADVNILTPAIRESDDKTASITLQDGINVLNITAKELNDYEHAFNIENVQGEKETYSVGNDKIEGVKYKGTQTLIINLNMESNDAITLNSKVNVKRYDGTDPLSDVSNKEANALEGTIILWNIYNSNAENKMYSGTLNINDSEYGSILAPEANINAQGGMNGNVIANKIETHAESHRCDFIGALPSFTSTTPDPEVTTPASTPDSEGDNEPEVTTPASTPDSEGDNEPEVTTPASTPDSEGDNEPEVTTPASTPDSEGDNEPEVTTPASTPDSEGDNEPEVTTPASTPDSEGDNEPEVTTPVSSPEPEVSTSPSTADSGVAPDDDDNNTTTTTTVPVASPESTTTTANDGVADDGDDNGKTTTTPTETTPVETTTTTSHDEGVADGGDGNDKDTGTGSDGDENNRPPKTGDSAPAALAVALIGSAIVITALKKNKDK